MRALLSRSPLDAAGTLSAMLLLAAAPACARPNPFLDVCGNGLHEASNDEECDEGADNDDAGACTAACKLAVCGDGLVRAGIEACDEGAANDDAGGCTSQCALARCGDGLLQPPEICDDGDANKPAADGQGGCGPTCEPLARCGDGIVQPEWETCDDGDDDDTDECPGSCQIASCGDGFVRAGVEACDDGNDVDTDACRPGCVPAACGDGIVHVGVEACDDGDDDDTDACPGTCAWSRCGDGFVLSGVETCDDANDDPNDGCKDCALDRLVFVTSEFYGSKLNAFDGGFGRCQKDAFKLGHPHPEDFFPWLSDGETSPSEEFIRSKGRYVLSTGQVVAMSWDDLVDGALLHPINRTVDGVLLNEVPVWTATHPDGTGIGEGHCDGWTSADASVARYGSSDLADEGWTDYVAPGPLLCGGNAHLYCFEAR